MGYCSQLKGVLQPLKGRIAAITGVMQPLTGVLQPVNGVLQPSKGRIAVITGFRHVRLDLASKVPYNKWCVLMRPNTAQNTARGVKPLRFPGKRCAAFQHW